MEWEQVAVVDEEDLEEKVAEVQELFPGSPVSSLRAATRGNKYSIMVQNETYSLFKERDRQMETKGWVRAGLISKEHMTDAWSVEQVAKYGTLILLEGRRTTTGKPLEGYKTIYISHAKRDAYTANIELSVPQSIEHIEDRVLEHVGNNHELELLKKERPKLTLVPPQSL